MQENPKVRASEHIPADMRPMVTEPFHTAELPPTPQRDRSLPAQLWIEAPPELKILRGEIAHQVAAENQRATANPASSAWLATLGVAPAALDAAKDGKFYRPEDDTALSIEGAYVAVPPVPGAA